MKLNTCRFCDGMMSDNLIKYGARHYAHHICYLDAGKSLAKLPLHVIENFPYFLLKERGLLGEVEQIVKAKRDQLPGRYRLGALGTNR